MGGKLPSHLGEKFQSFFTFTGDITTFSIDRKKNASGEPNLPPVIKWYTRENEEQFQWHFVQILFITHPERLGLFWEFRRHASEIIRIFHSTAFDLISYLEWNYLLISLVNIWSNLVPVKGPFPLAAGDQGKRLHLIFMRDTRSSSWTMLSVKSPQNPLVVCTIKTNHTSEMHRRVPQL